ncbi:hypothetical protein D3C87_2027950 [compost metagenome]
MLIFLALRHAFVQQRRSLPSALGEPFLSHFKYRLGIGDIIHNAPDHLPDAVQLVQLGTAL